MELKDFIATSLKEIVAGVKMAQDEIQAQGGYVNPAAAMHKLPDDYVGMAEGKQPVYRIDFDVAVTAASGEKSGASLGVQVASLFDAKIGAGSDAQRQTVSRIRFSVPLALPVDQSSLDKQNAADADRKRRQDAAMRAAQHTGSSWMGR